MSNTGRNELGIWINGLRAGTWRVGSDRLDELIYDDDWYDNANSMALSLSLPLGVPGAVLRGAPVANYFDNLLPDSTDVRRRIAGRYKTPSTSTFELLSAVGRDCVGAIQLLPPTETPHGWDAINASPLTNEQVRSHLERVTGPGRQALMDEDDLRISIAGAQEKSGLLQIDGQWLMPHGSTPTNRILKLPLGPIGGGHIPLRDSLHNEWLCSQIVRAFGIAVAHCEVTSFAGFDAISVHRFDRAMIEAETGPLILRLPQEDFCQVLGVPPHLKYEAEGGPGYLSMAKILEHSSNAERDRETLFSAQVIFWMLLAIDGHAKNFSLMLSGGTRFQLAPLYDVISMWPYAGNSHDKAPIQKLKMAMAVVGESGKHYVWSKIQRRHFEHMGQLAGVRNPAALIDGIVQRTPDVVRQMLGQLPSGFPMHIAQAILYGVADSAQKLGRSSAPD